MTVWFSCSMVTIAPAHKNAIEPAIPFIQRPDIFVAQFDAACMVEWDHDTLYPEPGPDSDVTTNIVGNSVQMSYNVCKPINGVGNHPRGSASLVGPSPAAGSPQAAHQVDDLFMVASNLLTTRTVLSDMPSTTSALQAESSVISYLGSGNTQILVESPDNTCGRGTNYTCPAGQCCSKHGYVST